MGGQVGWNCCWWWGGRGISLFEPVPGVLAWRAWDSGALNPGPTTPPAHPHRPHTHQPHLYVYSPQLMSSHAWHVGPPSTNRARGACVAARGCGSHIGCPPFNTVEDAALAVRPSPELMATVGARAPPPQPPPSPQPHRAADIAPPAWGSPPVPPCPPPPAPPHPRPLAHIHIAPAHLEHGCDLGGGGRGRVGGARGRHPRHDGRHGEEVLGEDGRQAREHLRR